MKMPGWPTILVDSQWITAVCTALHLTTKTRREKAIAGCNGRWLDNDDTMLSRWARITHVIHTYTLSLWNWSVAFILEPKSVWCQIFLRNWITTLCIDKPLLVNDKQQVTIHNFSFWNSRVQSKYFRIKFISHVQTVHHPLKCFCSDVWKLVNPLTPTVTIWVQLWASECPDVKNYKRRLNPVWHRLLYSCTQMATVGVKGLISLLIVVCDRSCQIYCHALAGFIMELDFKALNHTSDRQVGSGFMSCEYGCH